MGTEEVKIIAASPVQFPQILVISETQVSMNKGIPPREYRPIRATHVIICGRGCDRPGPGLFFFSVLPVGRTLSVSQGPTD